jgi:hypothetical protein
LNTGTVLAREIPELRVCGLVSIGVCRSLETCSRQCKQGWPCSHQCVLRLSRIWTRLAMLP